MANLDIIINAKDNASRTISGAAGNVGKLRTAMLAGTGVAAGLGVALLGAGVQTAKTAKEIDNLTKRTRVNAREAQRINGVYKRFGLDITDTTDLFQELNLAISEGQRGNKKYIEAFDELNLSFEHLNSLSPEMQVYAVADALDSVGNSADRTFLASELLTDEIGGRFLTIFGEGSQNVRMMADELERAGVIMDDVAVANGVALQESIGQLQVLFEGFITQVGSAVVPLLLELAQAALPLVQAGFQLLLPILQGVIALLKPLAAGVTGLLDVFGVQTVAALKTTNANVGVGLNNMVTQIADAEQPVSAAAGALGDAINNGVVDGLESANANVETATSDWVRLASEAARFLARLGLDFAVPNFETKLTSSLERRQAPTPAKTLAGYPLDPFLIGGNEATLGLTPNIGAFSAAPAGYPGGEEAIRAARRQQVAGTQLLNAGIPFPQDPIGILGRIGGYRSGRYNDPQQRQSFFNEFLDTSYAGGTIPGTERASSSALRAARSSSLGGGRSGGGETEGGGNVYNLEVIVNVEGDLGYENEDVFFSRVNDGIRRGAIELPGGGCN